MNVATIPPGGVALPTSMSGFELMLYILEGRVRHEYGPGLKKSIENEAGDFIYIEPGVPHEVFNLSDTEPVVAVVARSDASEWENIVPYDRNDAGNRIWCHEPVSPPQTCVLHWSSFLHHPLSHELISLSLGSAH